MNKYQLLLDETRTTLYHVLWTQKIHEKQADIFKKRYSILQNLSIIFTAATAGGLIALVNNIDNIIFKILTTLLSFTSIFISLYLKSNDLIGLVKEHKEVANKLIAERDELVDLIRLIKIQIEKYDVLESKYYSIKKEIDLINNSSPRTNNNAVIKATKDLGVETDSSIETVVDNYLTGSLKGNIQEGN